MYHLRVLPLETQFQTGISSYNYLTINPQRQRWINNSVVDKSLTLPPTSSTPHSSIKGLESDSPRSKRNGAWGAVLGTAVAVACVGLVAYFILRKKHKKGFTHRKLVEEYPSDPGMLAALPRLQQMNVNFPAVGLINIDLILSHLISS